MTMKAFLLARNITIAGALIALVAGVILNSSFLLALALVLGIAALMGMAWFLFWQQRFQKKSPSRSADGSCHLKIHDDPDDLQPSDRVFMVTDDKRTARELRIKELAIESSITAIAIADLEGKITYVNEAFLNSWAFQSPCDVVGKSALDFWQEPEKAQHIFTAIRQNRRWIGELVGRKQNGDFFNVQLLATAICDSQGTPLAFVASFIDITEQKQAEQALQVSLEKYRVLFEAFPMGITVTDKQGHILEANPSSEELLGLATRDHIRRTIDGVEWKIISPQGEPMPTEEYASVRALKENRIIRDVEMGIVKNENEVTWLNVTAAPIPLKDYGVAITYHDITQRKRAEMERDKAQAQVIHAQKMESLGRLAGGVAHDFHNMLYVILGHVEIAMRDMLFSHPLYSHLQEIRNAARRSADLTRQLLAFARHQTASPRALNLNDTIEGILKMLRRLIGENIELLWKPQSDLWKVKIDPSQIDQILANLCVNARDAIGGVGKITIETANVTLETKECSALQGALPGCYAMLSIRDNGCGMGKDTLDHIFEPFFTTKKIGQGTGLGLATVYGIVQQNGGYITVESRVGKGSIFHIYLPQFIDGNNTLLPEEARSSLLPQGRGETVLLVEDETMALNLGRNLLEGLGYNVLPAKTPIEAIKKVTDYPGKVHLLITDVVMPEMNGQDLAHRILSLKPDIKTLFVSGYPADVISTHGILNKGVEFLPKPFTRSELALKLNDVLRQGLLPLQ